MRLEIVVTADCRGCREARAIARDVRDRLLAVDVEVIELDGGQAAPSGVVATPTYLLDGRVISLGNPRREWLLEEIARQQKGEASLGQASV